MNIAIIAQDTKKELMVQFCIAYCGILGKHKLCSTSRTGKLVAMPPVLKFPVSSAEATAAVNRLLPELPATKSIFSFSSAIR